jgi:hypothetical protein
VTAPRGGGKGQAFACPLPRIFGKGIKIEKGGDIPNITTVFKREDLEPIHV